MQCGGKSSFSRRQNSLRLYESHGDPAAGESLGGLGDTCSPLCTPTIVAYSMDTNNALQAVENFLQRHSAKYLLVTGHSLGAAMATVAAIDLKARGFRPTAVVTFGVRGHDNKPALTLLTPNP